MSTKIAALFSFITSRFLSASSTVISTSATEEGAIVGDLLSCMGGLGLRTEAGAGEGVGVRVLEAVERLRSGLPAFAR